MSTQRRKITYGRSASKQQFSKEFQSLSIKTPQKKIPHGLTTPGSDDSPSPSAKRGPAVFDVPDSDSDSSSIPSPARPAFCREEPSHKKQKRYDAPPPSHGRHAERGRLQPKPGPLGTTAAHKRTTFAPSSRQASQKLRAQSNSSRDVSRGSSVEPKPVPVKRVHGASHASKASAHSNRNAGTAIMDTTPSAGVFKGVGLPVLPKVSKRPIDTIHEALEQSVEPLGDDVFDFPEDQSKLRTTPRKDMTEKAAKRGRIERPSTPPGTSAMLSPQSTPAKTPMLATTPRQARMWDSLLADDSASSNNPPIAFNGRFGKDAEARVLPRARLIDALRTAPSSPVASDDENDNDNLHDSPNLNNANLSTAAEDEHPLQSSQPDYHVPASQASGPKITYAQQRSFLQNEAQSIDELLSQPLDLGVGLAASKKKPLQLQPRNADDDEDTERTLNSMKNIHELRAAGDERRFDDDMNGIIDDISTHDKGGRSAKRAALLDLVKKLSDPSLKSRFVGRSLEADVFKRSGPEQDPICGAALCACVTLILAEPTDPRSAALLMESPLHATVSGMLDLTKDIRSIAKDRQTNMARAAQSTVIDLATGLDAVTFWNGRRPKTISPCLLALKGAETLERKLRECGHAESLMDAALISKIVTLLSNATETLRSAGGGHDSVAAVSMDLCISALESCSILRTSMVGEDMWNKAALGAVGRALSMLLSDIAGYSLSETRLLCLRLCLNLANNSPVNSDAFADVELVGKLMTTVNNSLTDISDIVDDPQRQDEFDELVLELGTMFNLAEMSSRARNVMIVEHLEQLQQLVVSFRAARGKVHEAESLEASQANVAYGYLAVLLGNICVAPNGLQAVCSRLPEKNPKILVEAIEEFISHHRTVDQQGDSDVWKGFTGRLQTVADTLKGAC